ncbi:S49 family peptidase [Spirosoma sp. RP8]|uniref:S49 family peptidase n=1 Tax=Spirosoma liriopis TaxID=2937440 RepID=A0ABT0HL83_9BACT|nr:S49 family peptidase [Spirosoma liriopis]MCK8492912.1 S49 family peptidase [Spirosoma liriopis]
MTGNFLSGAWAIAKIHENAIKAAIQGDLFQSNVLGYSAQLPDHLLKAADYSYEKAWIDYLSINGHVPVIPVQGTMSRGYTYDNYFSNTFLMKLIYKAAEDDSKVGAILNYNSGGGTVDSTDEFNAAVAYLASKKPVISQITFCASAALWSAAPSTEIMMGTGPLAKIGSIGTIYIHTNVSKALEQQGLDVQIYRSTGSIDKAKLNPYEELDEETEAQIQADLDAANKAFKSGIRAGRGSKLTSDSIWTGKVYNAQDAIKLGLADSTGDMNKAYKRVLQLQ